MPDSLSVTDNRTGKTYELPITDGTIHAIDLRQIKTDADDFGLMSYDPAFTNTASCRSAITFIDGDKGILSTAATPSSSSPRRAPTSRPRTSSSTASCPPKAELEEWTHNITHHTIVHENIKKFLDGFHYDAHPMGMLVGTVGALSTFYPDANHVARRRVARDPDAPPDRQDADARRLRLPPHRGMPFVYPDNDLCFPGNFLHDALAR